MTPESPRGASRELPGHELSLTCELQPRAHRPVTLAGHEERENDGAVGAFLDVAGRVFKHLSTHGERVSDQNALRNTEK